MTKFAVCLYGRFGNRFNPQAGEAGLNYIKEIVTRGAEVDYFVCSYDLENQNNIVSALGDNLVSSRFEKAPNHEENWVRKGGNVSQFELRDHSRSIEGTLRFLAQRDGSIRLMLDHARSNGAEYAGVLICRIDLGQIDRANQRFPQRVSESPALASVPIPIDRVFFATWNQLNEGLPDQWFLCSVKDAEIMLGASERVGEYLISGSDYLDDFLGVIPDSEFGQPFSNAKNHVERSETSSSRHASLALDNHLLHKYDFMKIRLYQRLAPAFDSGGIAHLTYTHSSYLDGWHMSHKAQEKHLGRFFKEYVAIESSYKGERIPADLLILHYDESLTYTERLKSVVEKIPDEFVFFTHEDMPLTRTPVTNALIEGRRLLERNPRNAVVRFIRVGRGLEMSLDRPIRLPYFCHVSRLSRWQFSIQPSLWKREKLLELLNNSPKGTVWDFEVSGQRVFSRLGMRAFQPISSGPKRGKHHSESSIYPYVATAIVKGKWNTLEYPELAKLVADQKNAGFPERGLLS